MEDEAQRDTDKEAQEHKDDVLTGYVGAGLFAVEAHDFQGRDLSYTLSDVDVIQVKENDECERGGADDHEHDDVVQTLHCVREALSGIERRGPGLDVVVVRQVGSDFVRLFCTLAGCLNEECLRRVRFAEGLPVGVRRHECVVEGVVREDGADFEVYFVLIIAI